jgi:hypothetical protein
MRRTVGWIAGAALGLAVLALATPSHAWDRGHRRYGHHHHHGHHGHWHWGGPRVFVGISPAYGWGYYPGYYGYYAYPPLFYSPYAYGPPAVVRVEPEVYVQRSPAQAYWYYCESAGEYYPRVPSCPEPWVKVPPQPE